VLLHVNLEALGTTVRLIAILEGANECLLLVMGEHMVLEVPASHKGFLAVLALAFEGLLARLKRVN
jgi:hypothetical protein